MEQMRDDRAEFSSETAEGDADDLFVERRYEIEATLAPRFGFATHQSAVPVLRQL